MCIRDRLHIVHPFYFVDAEIPIIGGYDLLREAHIVIDTKSAQAWSEHPDVANHSSVSDKVFPMAQPLSLPNSMIPIVPEEATPASAVVVTEATPRFTSVSERHFLYPPGYAYCFD